MKITYLKDNKKGKMIPCKRSDATHVEMEKRVYDMLLSDEGLEFIRQRIDAIKAVRQLVKKMTSFSSDVNDQFNVFCEEYSYEDLYTACYINELGRKLGLPHGDTDT